MKLASLLQPALIRTRATAADLAGAQAGLLDILAARTGARPQPLLTALAEREALGSTIVAPGVAFPHARVDTIDDFYVLIGTYPEGIPVADQAQPVRLVVLFLLPEGQSNLYLRCVSAMARLLNLPGMLDRLVEVPSAEGLVAFVEQTGVLVQDVVTAVDLIKPGAAPAARPTTTLREIADLMVIHNTTHIPVVDETDRYLGMVDANRLLRVGLPDYLLAMESLSFLSTFEPFQELLKQEQSTTAAAILCTDYPTFMAHTPMIVVAGRLVGEGLARAPVLAPDGRLVGMISTLDFVHKVVRA